MYTYDSFVTAGSFTLMRPVFFTLLLASLALSLLIFIPKLRQKLLNSFSVISLSVLFAILAVQVLFYDSIIVDEIGLGGDSVSTMTAITILAFSLLNPLAFFWLQSKKAS